MFYVFSIHFGVSMPGQDSLQLNSIVDKLRHSLDEDTIASMAEVVYGHPESANDPSVALAELGVDPAVQAAAMVLLKEHMEKPASVEKHVVSQRQPFPRACFLALRRVLDR